MATITVDRGDLGYMEFTTEGQIKAALNLGTINHVQAIDASARLMMAQNLEYSTSADQNTLALFDPNLTIELAKELAESVVTGWDIKYTTPARPPAEIAQERLQALEAQELGAELTARGLREAAPIVSRDVQRRFPGFGRATPIAREGMAPFYQTQDALVNYFANLAPSSPMSEMDWARYDAPTFQSFLEGTQPDVGVLRGNLQNVRNILGTPYEQLGGPAAMGIHTTFQDPWNQLQAAIQPGLAAISPALRGAYRRGAGQFQGDWQAMNPEQQFLDFAGKSGFF